VQEEYCFYFGFELAWTIHESRLLQMQGTGCAAVVLHKNKNEKIVKVIILKRILHITEKKLIIKTPPFFYE
jgi:hypothetical protein